MATARRQRAYLDIDFDRKDHAKRHGARWDDARKKWYVLGEVPAELQNYVDSATNGALALAALVPETAVRAMPALRTPPQSDRQTDLFVPSLYDVATKDAHSIMDLAVFRLSKKATLAGKVFEYDLPDRYVEVKAGPDGMASVWDYDIVLMAVAHLADAMNRYRAGKGDMPSRLFRLHASEILKFCRRGDGGNQAATLIGTLDRLLGTIVKVVHKPFAGGLPEAQAQGLIAAYTVVSMARAGKSIGELEIQIPEWIYKAVTESDKPAILTVSDDYFLISTGIGRFLYRLARRAAGTSEAKWSFALVHSRSKSSGSLKKFTENLRKLIAENSLPEYSMSEEAGKEGPLLVMRYRGNAVGP